MSFNKRTYVDGETVITAENLNDIQDELIRLGRNGMSDDVKQALLQLASKVAYIDDDGQDYYDALESALYPDVTLVSISAVYTQSGTVYDTDSLDSLKDDLVVTALYSDASTATVTAYTLSGSLTAGTSTITVTYSGKTTTFNVTVTEDPWDFKWDYTMGRLEDQAGLHTDVSGTGGSSMTTDGEKIWSGNTASNYYQILFDNDSPYKYMPNGYGTIELVCYSVLRNDGNGNSLRLTCAENATNRLTLLQNDHKWKLMKNSDPTSSSNTTLASITDNTPQTVRIVQKGTKADVFINGTQVATNIDATSAAGTSNNIMHQNGGGSQYYSVLQSLKIKLGE